MRNKLKAILIPLSLVSMSMVPLTSVTKSTIDTYDTSPAKSRENQVKTNKGYNAHTQNISATIRGIEYNNIKASVYITDTLYLNDISTNELVYGDDSDIIGFYVTLDLNDAVSTGGTQYIYQTGDEEFFKVNLYPSSYSNYSAATASTYQYDVMSADFKGPEVTGNYIFTSYQIIVPQIEMGWEVELLNDSNALTAGAINFYRDEYTKSVMSEDFLISDYYPSVFDIERSGPYKGYEYENDEYLTNPYIEKIGLPTYVESDDLSTSNVDESNTLSFKFQTHYDYSLANYTPNENQTAMQAPSGSTISGWITIPTVDGDTEYVIEITNSNFSNVITDGIKTSSSQVCSIPNDCYGNEGYTLYYETTISLSFYGPTNTKEYNSKMYKYSTVDSEYYKTNSIHYNDNASVNNLYSFSGASSDAEFDSMFDWSSATYQIEIELYPEYEVYDEEYDRIVNLQYRDDDPYQEHTLYNDSFYIYSESTIDQSIKMTETIDPSGDVGNAVIGWLFLGFSVTTILGVAFYYSYKTKKKTLENQEEFKKINEELKKGDGK